MNYLVLECHPAYAVVLSSDGRFIKVANFNYQPGDVITDIIPMQDSPARISIFKRIKPALTAAAACLCLFLFAGGFMIFTPAGHLQMKINPEVSMTINRLDYVIGLDGLNEDGEKLIDTVSYKGKKTAELAKELADQALDLQYLKSDGMIRIYTEDGSAKWQQNMEQEVHDELEQYLDPSLHIQVVIGKEDEDIEMVETAEESSVSESTEEEQETESTEKETEGDDRDDEDDETVKVTQTTKSSETSAVINTKPAQTKPAQTKPAPTKPVIDEDDDDDDDSTISGGDYDSDDDYDSEDDDDDYDSDDQDDEDDDDGDDD